MTQTRATFKCPHCGAGSIVRTSQLLTELVRQSVHACANPVCGHTFVSMTEVIRTLSPSSMPRVEVELPLSSRSELQQLCEQIGHGRQPTTTKRSPLSA